jgi:hypothetical protein
MALGWAQTLQSCLVAYAARGDPRHAPTAPSTKAMLTTSRTSATRGDNARRHSGTMRAMGPYTALAYDWLYDKMG